MAIDFNKPVQTRDGRKVRILCRDRNSSQPIVGLITSPLDGKEELHSWHEDGRRLHGPGFYGYNDADLINIPERIDRWVPMFCEEGHGALASIKASRELAAAVEKRSEYPLLKLLRITYEDGKPVSVALEDI